MIAVTVEQLCSLARAYNNALLEIDNLSKLKVRACKDSVTFGGNVSDALFSGLTELANLDYQGNILTHIKASVDAAKPVDLFEGLCPLIVRDALGVSIRSHNAGSLAVKVKNYLADYRKSAERSLANATARLSEVSHITTP